MRNCVQRMVKMVLGKGIIWYYYYKVLMFQMIIQMEMRKNKCLGVMGLKLDQRKRN